MHVDLPRVLGVGGDSDSTVTDRIAKFVTRRLRAEGVVAEATTDFTSRWGIDGNS